MERDGQVQEETAVLPETGDAPMPGWLVGLTVVLLVWVGWYLVLAAR
ncbi:MAG TPA: hypothetical protein VIK93_07600 [Limnochordales bacterium]